MICNFRCTGHLKGVGCDSISDNITVNSGVCLTYWYNGTELDLSHPVFAGACPYNLDYHILLYYNVADKPGELNQRICGANCTCILCSACIDGYGIAVNDYNFHCVKCNTQYGWLLYVVSQLAPFLSVVLFDIGATSAPMNAFVFFSQIVTVSFYYTPTTFMFGYDVGWLKFWKHWLPFPMLFGI